MTDRGRVSFAGALAGGVGAPAARATGAAASAAAPAVDLGPLPQWRLDDLYPGMDSPRFAADLARAATEAKRFAATYQGKLAELAQGAEAGPRLFETHFRDLNAKNLEVPVGDGVIPITAIFRQLMKQGYAGTCSLEQEIDQFDPLPGMQKSFAYMRGVVAGLRG